MRQANPWGFVGGVVIGFSILGSGRGLTRRNAEFLEGTMPGIGKEGRRGLFTKVERGFNFLSDHNKECPKPVNHHDWQNRPELVK